MINVAAHIEERQFIPFCGHPLHNANVRDKVMAAPGLSPYSRHTR